MIEIIVIQESFAPGVPGERIQRVLRLLEVTGISERGGPGVDAGVSRRALGRVAERRLRHQAARVYGPKGNACFDSGVDRGVKLGLVVNAVQSKATGKVNERFLFGQLAKHLGRGLQGRELAIGVEDIELAVVLAEGGPGVGAACIVDAVLVSLAFAHDEGCKYAEKLVAIVGEVLKDIYRTALVAKDGYHIDGRHLGANKLLPG